MKKFPLLWMGLILLLLVQSYSAHAQQLTLGLFESQSDIGKVKIAGSASYNAVNQTYLMEGSGTNMWFGKDEFHFMWKRLKGDFILTTRGKLLGKGIDPHRKIGWMVRTTLDSSSTHINAAVHGDGLTSLQFRRTIGANTEEVRSTMKSPDIIQLERKGNTYTMSVAHFGEPFTTSQVTDLTLGDEVYVGLFICSHNKDVSEKGLYDNVRITIPARDNFVPYREYIGSNLEVMDVEKGSRQILYQVPYSIQAPNWTKDGRSLIYSANGHLLRFDLKTQVPTLINTDFANRNNNDHVLSFDGKQLAISHHSKDDGGKSVGYTVPVGGGIPKRITSGSPSYMHGWSPDGKFLIFTGGRAEGFDIYKISANGGNESRLTTASGLDDGPEYSPDGKYIYFNSNRNGTMHLFRMKPNGSNQEELTTDEYQDWFPHLSPDGKWIVFISFPKTVDSGDHPFYKPVYIRLMPTSGGKPKVIAYLYGGQGTINVPSWSPDSKRIALVSNTDF